MSSKHQVTIARAAFDAAGLREGDVVAVRAVGPGRLELTSLDALFERHRGRLSGGEQRRAQIEAARDEWA